MSKAYIIAYGFKFVLKHEKIGLYRSSHDILKVHSNSDNITTTSYLQKQHHFIPEGVDSLDNAVWLAQRWLEMESRQYPSTLITRILKLSPTLCKLLFELFVLL